MKGVKISAKLPLSTNMNSNNVHFFMSQDVIDLGLNGVYLVITGLRNSPDNQEFEGYKNTVLNKSLKEYCVDDFVKNDAILQGFRDLHIRVGRSNRKFVSSPEALITRFLKTTKFPKVNLLVDIYNLVSLKTKLAFGAHDIEKIDGNVNPKLTTGNEAYIPLGA